MIKYNQLMEQVVLSDATKAKILYNLQTAQSSPQATAVQLPKAWWQRSLKWTGAIAACLIILVVALANPFGGLNNPSLTNQGMVGNDNQNSASVDGAQGTVGENNQVSGETAGGDAASGNNSSSGSTLQSGGSHSKYNTDSSVSTAQSVPNNGSGTTGNGGNIITGNSAGGSTSVSGSSGGNDNSSGSNGGGMTTSSSVIDYDSISELASSLKFPLSVPKALPSGYGFEGAANQFGMALIVYGNGKNSLKYYMVPQSEAVSSSGQYVRDLQSGVKLYNDGDGYWEVVWSASGYVYNLVSDAQIPDEQWLTVVNSLAPYNQ